MKSMRLPLVVIIFTARNEVGARLYFHRRLFTGGGHPTGMHSCYNYFYMPPPPLGSATAACLSVCPSIHVSACLSVCLSVCPSIHLSACLSVCPSIHVSVCLSVCLCVHLSSVCLSVHSSVYPCVFINLCVLSPLPHINIRSHRDH